MYNTNLLYFFVFHLVFYHFNINPQINLLLLPIFLVVFSVFSIFYGFFHFQQPAQFLYLPHINKKRTVTPESVPASQQSFSITLFFLFYRMVLLHHFI